MNNNDVIVGQYLEAFSGALEQMAARPAPVLYEGQKLEDFTFLTSNHTAQEAFFTHVQRAIDNDSIRKNGLDRTELDHICESFSVGKNVKVEKNKGNLNLSSVISMFLPPGADVIKTNMTGAFQFIAANILSKNEVIQLFNECMALQNEQPEALIERYSTPQGVPKAGDAEKFARIYLEKLQYFNARSKKSPLDVFRRAELKGLEKSLFLCVKDAHAVVGDAEIKFKTEELLRRISKAHNIPMPPGRDIEN